jgi:hypothetical protein
LASKFFCTWEILLVKLAPVTFKTGFDSFLHSEPIPLLIEQSVYTVQFFTQVSIPPPLVNLTLEM